MTYHFSKFVWVVDVERNRAATEAAVSCMYERLSIVDPTARRLEAKLDGGKIAGNLRRPASARAARVPLVILLLRGCGGGGA